jgi:membrane associated rhomboid family serine protease
MSQYDPDSRFPQSRPQAVEPLFNLPGVVLALCIALALVHTVREFLADETDFQFVSALAFVPARLSLWLDPARLDEIVRAGLGTRAGLDVASRVQMVRLMLLDHDNTLWSMLTYGLLHGSWVHLISNLLWLAAFGTPVARRLGPLRFLALMILATIAGALAHWWTREFEIIPMVGASAAIAGAMAGAARFVFSSGFRFGGIGTDAEARAIPAEPLFGLWKNGRAVGFVAIWFVTNAVFGSGLIPIAGEEASIAWQAHVGGFLAGLLLFPLLDRGAVRQA